MNVYTAGHDSDNLKKKREVREGSYISSREICEHFQSVGGRALPETHSQTPRVQISGWFDNNSNNIHNIRYDCLNTMHTFYAFSCYKKSSYIGCNCNTCDADGFKYFNWSPLELLYIFNYKI